MADNWLTKEQVLNIPKNDLPLAVLSRGFYSHFATQISIFQRDLYNHFMWMVSPGKFVSQDFLFHEVSAEEYLQGEHQLKFWRGKNWSKVHKLKLISEIEEWLKKSWWKRRYDVLQLFGIALHIRQLQVPWLHICSDWAGMVNILDPSFPDGHLTPGEVNEWFKRNNNYEVYGKFTPDD